MATTTATKIYDVLGLERFISLASPGDRIVYHEGNLSIDRDHGMSRLRTDDRHQLGNLAGYAWRMHDAGLLRLVQERVGEGFLYIAERTSLKAAA